MLVMVRYDETMPFSPTWGWLCRGLCCDLRIAVWCSPDAMLWRGLCCDLLDLRNAFAKYCSELCIIVVSCASLS